MVEAVIPEETLIAVKTAALEELVFLAKRVRVLPVRRAKRKDAERLRAALARYFRKLASAVPVTRLARGFLSFVQKQEEIKQAAELVVQQWMTTEGADIVRGLDFLLLEHGARSFANAARKFIRVQRLGVDFSLPREQAIEFLRLRGAERIRGITEVTRRQMAEVLAKGMEEGLGVDAIGKRLRREVMEMSRERAKTIAWTETADAYGAAQERLAQEVRAQGKRWLSANDNLVCALCRANQDQGKIPVGQAFVSGAPWEAQHPSCRCTTLLEDIPLR